MAQWVFDGMRELPFLWIMTCMLLGGMAASFAGVAAWRMKRLLPSLLGHADETALQENTGHTGLAARSRCEGCGRTLGLVDLIPVLGWLVRRGACPACGHAVPALYPVVETLGALLFAAVGWCHGPGWTAVVVMLMTAVLMAASWVDWETYWVPDRLSFPCILVGLYLSPFEPSAALRLWGLAAAGGVTWLGMAVAEKIKRDCPVAWGDVLLMCAGGAFFGLDEVVALLLMTSICMLAYALPMRIWRMGMASTALHREMLDGADPMAVPMGPAIAAAITCISFHPRLLDTPFSTLLGVM